MTDNAESRYSATFIYFNPDSGYNETGCVLLNADNDARAKEMAEAFLNTGIVNLLNIHRGKDLIHIYPQTFGAEAST